jgi:protein-S-isoprenylcysteine O-methyltransferase Ste14
MMQNTFETLSDWLFIVGIVALGVMDLVGWMMNSRRPQARQPSVWLKIVVGLVEVPVSLYVGYLLWTPFVSVSPGASLVLRVIGLAMFLAGGAFIVWARWTLGKNWSDSGFGVRLQVDHTLIRRGPFALVRHPMYTGFWMALAGLALAYRTWAVLILLLMELAIFYRRAGREEATLAETFGDEWRAYTAHVPKFVPRLR